MPEKDAYFEWNCSDLVLRKYIEEYGETKRRIYPDKLTPSSRKRLWAYVLLRGWHSEEYHDYMEDGLGYSPTETITFYSCDIEDGDFEAKRWLLALLLDKESERQYSILQIRDHIADLERDLAYWKQHIQELSTPEREVLKHGRCI